MLPSAHAVRPALSLRPVLAERELRELGEDLRIRPDSKAPHPPQGL